MKTLQELCDELAPQHQDVLRALDAMTLPFGEYCVAFRSLEKATKLDCKSVRQSCRYLRTLGLADYHRSLWNDDGLPAGAGYCITQNGQRLMRGLAVPRPTYGDSGYEAFLTDG